MSEIKSIRCKCCGYLVTDSEHRGCLRAAEPLNPDPMSDGRIAAIWKESRHPLEGWVHRFARAIEKETFKSMAILADALTVLELLAAEADAGTVMIPSGLRLTIDAALIKAGRKAAPVRQKPCETCGGRGEVGGWRQGDGYGSDPCPDCSPNSSKAAPTAVRHVTIAGGTA